VGPGEFLACGFLFERVFCDGGGGIVGWCCVG